jgi:hypothetical protein
MNYLFLPRLELLAPCLPRVGLLVSVSGLAPNVGTALTSAALMFAQQKYSISEDSHGLRGRRIRNIVPSETIDKTSADTVSPPCSRCLGSLRKETGTLNCS